MSSSVLNELAGAGRIDRKRVERKRLQCFERSMFVDRPASNSRHSLRSQNLGISMDVATKSSAEVAPTTLTHSIGWHLEQGLREEMEDEVHVEHNTDEGFIYVGVFDGHAGSSTSKFLKEKLYSECLKELKTGLVLKGDTLDIESALSQAFKNLDDWLLEWQAEHENDEVKYSGSTATTVFVNKERVIVANAGDCRAVLCTAGEARDLCNDHRPFGDDPASRSEVERIKAAGGWISKGRVCGYLAVSRAFGDLMYKNHREHLLADGLKKGKWTKRFVQKLRLEEDWVTAMPEVNCVELGSEDEFVLVGSDGLWDSVTSSEAVNFIKKKTLEGMDAEKAAKALAHFVLNERNGDDNISVVLLKLK